MGRRGCFGVRGKDRGCGEEDMEVEGEGKEKKEREGWGGLYKSLFFTLFSYQDSERNTSAREPGLLNTGPETRHG